MCSQQAYPAFCSTCPAAGGPTASTMLAGSRAPRPPEPDLHTQRVMQMGVIASGYIHDLNNLLMVIGGGASLAEDEVPTGHPCREHLADIQRAIQSASAITRHLLDFVRQQPIQRQTINLRGLLQDYLPLGTLIVGQRVRLTAAIDPGLWPVRADPVQVEQLLLNLLTNARHAMPEGGEVTLTAANDRRGAGEYVCLTVTDTGKGITPDIAEQIFEPFFSGGASGSGLGLAICGQIVSQLGGMIEVESAPGQGASFRICLPRATAADDDPGALQRVA